MRTQLVRAVLLLAGGLALLGAWVALGRQAADSLRDGDRYAVAFADIDCVPPDHFTRAEFLSEVQYLGNYPDRLTISNPAFATNLANAFAAHPLVESVQRVEAISRRIQVRLTYRVPVLAIPDGASVRLVDGKGVVLPLAAGADGLPRFFGPILDPPAGAPGSRWGDARVEAAAQLASFLRQANLPLRLERIVLEGGEYSLIARGTRVAWGHLPGREKAGEPPAADKVARLRQLADHLATASERDRDLSQPATAKANH